MTELAPLHVDEAQIAALLPNHVPLDRFKTVLISAVKQTPAILTALPITVNQAVTQAAEDGLLPDGREGVINVYNEKRKINGVEKWVPCAKWVPMVHGFRKRAMELSGIIIDAQIVCANDYFVWRGGDDPKIEHEPASLDKNPGEIVGAYAIFRKQENGALITLHREVMRKAQLSKVKECVKAQSGLMMTKFLDEWCRKTVVRRGIKTVPAVHPDLMRLVSRTDDDFDFTRGQPGAAIAPAVVMPPSINASVAPMPPPIHAAAGLPQGAPAMMPPSIKDAVSASTEAQQPVEASQQEADPSKEDRFLTMLDRLLGDVEPGDMPRLEQVWNKNEATIERKLSAEAKARAFALWDRHHERVAPSREAAQ